MQWTLFDSNIRPFLEINTSLIKRFNTCTKKELPSHYDKLASVIINYKHQHRVYKKRDLTKIHLIDSFRIATYLTTNENKSVSRTY